MGPPFNLVQELSREEGVHGGNSIHTPQSTTGTDTTHTDYFNVDATMKKKNKTEKVTTTLLVTQTAAHQQQTERVR